mmetsp:Transcript_11690/g.28796  ORF Transcript_11690/g.28796 Transcript_11690/m.28796 type:complete len:339 (-) Transcript_11690:282-1298(-)|eukprot:CAMPEP_0114517352 /NCGR_PEP_ID=MMETSP0109-20121206/17844_1 /TAXON_ID=29199 /ORGANISM="Chlorarachnion reptans, Strain CCCM449" /LENGTH=338 /DNA_ID=CAMNT_0001697859 /DNA_START=55 /DNA_END=1071 /DNA_ORIENTATION=+
MGIVSSCVTASDVVFCRESSGIVSELGADYAICQIPARKDEDRFSTAVGNTSSSGITPIVKSKTFSGDTLCLGVYDGHGGKETADILQAKCIPSVLKAAVESNKKSRRDKKKDGVSEKIITRVYKDLHTEAVKKFKTSGSCALNIWITNGENGSRNVLCSWTGDCRAAYFRGTKYKDYSDLTSDHSPYRKDEKERIIEYGKTHGGAFVSRRRTKDGQAIGPLAVFCDDPDTDNLSLMMSRSIGDAMHSKACIPDPEFKFLKVARDERVRIIMGSDGLWRIFTNKLARRITKKLAAPSLAANRLAVESVWRTQKLSHLKLDDVTVIVVDVAGAGYKSER